MIYTIFIIVSIIQVNAEWVEITQQYYEKPVQASHRDIKRNPTNSAEEDFKENHVSNNKQIETVSAELIKPKKGNRIYIVHNEDGKVVGLSYPRNNYVKEKSKFEHETEETDINNSNDRNRTQQKTSLNNEDTIATTRNKGNRVYIVNKNYNHHVSDVSLEEKIAHDQENTYNKEESSGKILKDEQRNNEKYTTETNRVLTSKKANRIYFLYKDNGPILVNKPTLLKDNPYPHSVHTTQTTEQTTKYSPKSNHPNKKPTEEIMVTTQDPGFEEFNEQILEPYRSIRQRQPTLKSNLGNKTELKKGFEEFGMKTLKENKHTNLDILKVYSTTEPKKELTSKQEEHVHFIRNNKYTETILDNYDHVTVITPPLTEDDHYQNDEKVLEKIGNNELIRNMQQKPEIDKSEALETEYNQTYLKDIYKNHGQDEFTTISNKSDEKYQTTQRHEIKQSGKDFESKTKYESSHGSWIKGHVYKVPNLGHISRLDKNNPELMNITQDNVVRKKEKEEKHAKNTVEPNILIIKHPTAIVDKEKLESYDELPITRKEEVIDETKAMPEFITTRDQDFRDKIDEIKMFDIFDEEIEQNKGDNSDESRSNSNLNINDKSAASEQTTVETQIDHAHNPLENIIKFTKIVTDNIVQNTHTSFDSKMRYLQDLKDSITRNIEEHIEAAWPDDGSRYKREARGHHIDFPSSESALMTISFLTFAVYLIKLVLMVIQAYKNKTMMMPAVVAVSRAADMANKHFNKK